MGRRNGGYGGYRGRRTFHDILKWVAAILAVLVVILAGCWCSASAIWSFGTRGCGWSCPSSTRRTASSPAPAT